MCVLCGEFVMNVHWTDTTSLDANSNVIVGSHMQNSRQRDRITRERLANQILQTKHLKLEDWSGSKYILRDRKGSSTIIQDMGALWPAVEKMLGYKLDPLDAEFLLEFNQHAQKPEG